MHGFFFPGPSVLFATASTVFLSCHGASFVLSSVMECQLFFGLPCCSLCSLYHLSLCPVCSVTSPGVPTGLLSVLVFFLFSFHHSVLMSPLFYCLSWCPLCSITCPGICSPPFVLLCPDIYNVLSVAFLVPNHCFCYWSSCFVCSESCCLLACLYSLIIRLCCK